MLTQFSLSMKASNFSLQKPNYNQTQALIFNSDSEEENGESNEEYSISHLGVDIAVFTLFTFSDPLDQWALLLRPSSPRKAVE